ncbi:MAG: hypothetical protein NTZ07_00020 [Candidatus Woesebacteria bacterium]|nr:hypothetical protein [Candidatus Woesebacteria bacterium]
MSESRCGIQGAVDAGVLVKGDRFSVIMRLDPVLNTIYQVKKIERIGGEGYPLSKKVKAESNAKTANLIRLEPGRDEVLIYPSNNLG